MRGILHLLKLMDAMIPVAQRTRLLAWLQVSTNAGSLAGAIAGGVILDLLSFFLDKFRGIYHFVRYVHYWFFILPNDLPRHASSNCVTSSTNKAKAISSINHSVIVGLLTILGFVISEPHDHLKTPFSLYVSSVFNALTG